MIAYLYIAVGGALGSVARHWLSALAAARYGTAFPWGTIAVNVSGSLAIGLCAALIAPDGRWPESPGIRQFLMIGLCGGYTTFSAFSLQTLQLLHNRAWLPAFGNVALSLGACMIAVWLGYWLGTLFKPAA